MKDDHVPLSPKPFSPTGVKKRPPKETAMLTSDSSEQPTLDACYGDLIWVCPPDEKAPEAPSWLTSAMKWKAGVRADPASPTEVTRMCCAKQVWSICNTAPPCKSPVEPLVGPQEVAIRDTARIVHNAALGMDELQFDDDARRLPLLDGTQPLAGQLRKWHDDAFTQEQMVVYHIYELHEALAPTPDGSSVALDGKLIAIPVEPVLAASASASIEPVAPPAAPPT